MLKSTKTSEASGKLSVLHHREEGGGVRGSAPDKRLIRLGIGE